jgi:hypothetical protein
VSVGGQTCPRCGAWARAEVMSCALCGQRIGPVVDPLTAPLADVLAASAPSELATLNAPPAPTPPPAPVPPPAAPAPDAARPAGGVPPPVPPPEWLGQPEPSVPDASVAADEAAAAWSPTPTAPEPAPTWPPESVPQAWVTEAEQATQRAAGLEPTSQIDSETSVEAMLAMLAAEQHHMDAKSTPWARFFDDRPNQVVVMVGGSVAIALALFAAMAVLGFIF